VNNDANTTASVATPPEPIASVVTLGRPELNITRSTWEGLIARRLETTADVHDTCVVAQRHLEDAVRSSEDYKAQCESARADLDIAETRRFADLHATKDELAEIEGDIKALEDQASVLRKTFREKVRDAGLFCTEPRAMAVEQAINRKAGYDTTAPQIVQPVDVETNEAKRHKRNALDIVFNVLAGMLSGTLLALAFGTTMLGLKFSDVEDMNFNPLTALMLAFGPIMTILLGMVVAHATLQWYEAHEPEADEKKHRNLTGLYILIAMTLVFCVIQAGAEGYGVWRLADERAAEIARLKNQPAEHLPKPMFFAFGLLSSSVYNIYKFFKSRAEGRAKLRIAEAKFKAKVQHEDARTNQEAARKAAQKVFDNNKPAREAWFLASEITDIEDGPMARLKGQRQRLEVKRESLLNLSKVPDVTNARLDRLYADAQNSLFRLMELVGADEEFDNDRETLEETGRTIVDRPEQTVYVTPTASSVPGTHKPLIR